MQKELNEFLNKYKKLIFFALGLIILASATRLHFISKMQPGELTALICTVVGVILTVWQIFMNMENDRESRFEKLIDDLASDITSMKIASDKHDLIHDNRIMELAREIAEVRSQLVSHADLIGHKEVVEMILKARDRMTEIEIKLAVYTQVGEMITQLNNLQFRLDENINKCAALEKFLRT